MPSIVQDSCVAASWIELADAVICVIVNKNIGGSMKKKAIYTVLGAVLTMGASLLSQANTTPAPEPLMPSANEIVAARTVWRLMGDEDHSYLIRSRDENLARSVAISYLDMLDPDRMIFLASDVEKFTRKPMWSLAAMQGRAMVAPLKIHQVFQERVADRQKWLVGWKPRESYPKGATWRVDREDAKWPATPEEQNTVWQHYLDSVLLSSESGATPEKIAKEQATRFRRAATLPREEVIEAFLNSYASSIDPHAAYMLPATAENFAVDINLSLDGIGALLTEREGNVFIDEIIPNGPAQKSGQIQSGDQILAIAQESGEWVDARGMRSQDAVNLIRGKSGSTVRLRLAKGGDAKHQQEVSLVRSRVILAESGAKEKIITAGGKTFGWIKLPGFYADFRQDGKGAASATKDVEAALLRLKKAGVDGVILDLRDNGGGALGEAVSLVGLFLPPSDVVQILGADEKVVHLKSERKQPVWTGPLAVLVNRGSASASEIAAAALQDHGRALVLGEKTFGKGTVQSVLNLDKLWENDTPTLGEMKMTVAQFFRPSGQSTQLNGVVPDVMIEATLGNREGEDRYKNAAPAAKIPAVSTLSQPRWKTSIPALQAYQKQVAGSSEDFQAWLRVRKDLERFTSREDYPLNADEHQARKNEEAAWKKKAESELKRLGLSGKSGEADPIVKVAAEVSAKWLDRP